jgi:hypothetical protein
MSTFKYSFFSRNVSTGTPEVMVNFVTSRYEPNLLMPLVDNITKIPEVVCNWRLLVLMILKDNKILYLLDFLIIYYNQCRL